MAHPNINQRRKAVHQALQCGQLSRHKRKSLAAEFNCSTSAIASDVLALTVRTEQTIHVTQKTRERVRRRDGNQCQYCGTEDTKNVFVVEHVIPQRKGGIGKPFNLVVACQRCNVLKASRVWIPQNLDEITKEQPDWKIKILQEASINVIHAV